MSIDMQQATVADLQEKVAETHVLLRLERDEKDEERRFNIQSRIGQNLRDFYAALPYGDFTTLLQKFRLSLDKTQEYMKGVNQGMNEVSKQENNVIGAMEQRDPHALRPHPTALLIPPLSERDERELQTCIAKEGIRHPLDITPDGRILDGVHRWQYAKELGIPSLPVIIYHFTKPEEENLYAFDANSARRQMNEGQAAALALLRLPYEQALARTRRAHSALDTIHAQAAALVPIGTNAAANTLIVSNGKGKAATKAAKASGKVSTRTVYRAKKVQEKSPERFAAVLNGDVSIHKAYQQVKTEEKIEEVKTLQQTQRPLTDLEVMKKLDIQVQPYDVWSFPTCDSRFGHDYPGRIPGQLVAHCLYFWTEQGETVLDPMAGSGTTIDVCKVLNRRVLAYDAHPCREDISLHDLSTQGWPKTTGEAKLIFWDPPYFKKVDDGYGDKSISRLSRSEYLAFFDRMASTIPKTFHGRLAFLMSDYNDEEPTESIWLHDYIHRFTRHKWQVERIIHVPLSTQQIHPDIVKKFRVSKRLARLSRGLVVMSR